MSGVIDGGDWLKERIRQLEAALQANPTDAEREAIQAEIDQLKGEAKGRRRRGWRWLIWGYRPPGP